MLHLNAQTLGATGEANTLGASVGDLTTPRLAIAKTQSGTTLCVTPPAVGLTLRPGNLSSGSATGTARPRRLFNRELPPTDRLASHHLTTGRQPAHQEPTLCFESTNPPTNRRRQPQPVARTGRRPLTAGGYNGGIPNAGPTVAGYRPPLRPGRRPFPAGVASAYQPTANSVARSDRRPLAASR